MENERNIVNREHKDRLFKRISIFIDKIRKYQNQKLSLREAIDKAVDECIKEGILEKILRENREEVCSMLLTEYDEQAHIESEKKIAREEGREEEGRRMADLVKHLKEDGRIKDLDLLSDREARETLYKEYQLTD